MEKIFLIENKEKTLSTGQLKVFLRLPDLAICISDETLDGCLQNSQPFIRWMQLAEPAATEQDPVKLLQLIKKMDARLAAKQERHKKRPRSD